MATPLLRATSHLTGWLADRRIPRPLRAGVYRTYARATGASLDAVELPLAEYPSLGAFFVRRLAPGARPVDADAAALPSPCDGRVQDLSVVREGTILQAKGRAYTVAELLAGLDAGVDLEGGSAWTIYLSPRDYHRVHAPVACTLAAWRHVPGGHYSVRPSVLAARERVLATNERVVFRLDCAWGPLFLVMVGALNVARIRLARPEAPAEAPYGRGEELARFEMGSTVVLVAPPGGPAHPEGLHIGDAVLLGASIGRLAAV